MPIEQLAGSSFLDFSGYRQTTITGTTAADLQAAFDIDPHSVGDGTINMGLVLARNADPSALLSSDWATRQKALAAFNDTHTLWDTFGASKSDYDHVLSELNNKGITVIGDALGSDGYVTSRESRTIWVSLDSTTFQTLFGSGASLYSAYYDHQKYSLDYWTGTLSLPSDWHVVGLAPDEGLVPLPQNLAPGASVPLNQGSQSLGNSAKPNGVYYPNVIASDFYNFPLSGNSVATGTVGLVEPATGDALSTTYEDNDPATTAQFQAQLNAYLAQVGYTTPGSFYTVSNNGQVATADGGGERSLDVGVVAAIAPRSTIGLYAGSGTNNGAGGTTYTTYQAAFWDTVHNPEIVSSSWGDAQQPAPGSVFQKAIRELFVDAALRNITTMAAVGDGGSGDEMANGLTNLQYSYASPLGILVGGTSLSTMDIASADPSLALTLQQIASGNRATIWQLIAGGMIAPPASGVMSTVIETVWNNYVLTGGTLNPGFGVNETGTGGVDPTQPTPWYQTAYGLTPTTSDPLAQVGRGAPDVSALAGGNMYYLVPKDDMNGVHGDGGTSAAAPLWAALYAQFNAIFRDQKLPNLGYSNDLLYIASVVAPASFNDITYGSNTSSYVAGGPIAMADYSQGITATGFGYSATPGYDLTTGLGTPNGLLLARALTAVAHAQMSFETPDVLDRTVSNKWAAPVTESLLFQPVLTGDSHVDLSLGGSGYAMDGHASASFAWTARFAQQVLQSDFSPQLVTLFDAQSQATPFQATAQAGASLQLHLDGADTRAPQAAMSSPYGFVDFTSADGSEAVHVARAVAVAETAGGANDVDAVVRLRQVGTSDVDLMFYKVSDYTGTVDGRAPGQAGYEAAAQAHAYQTDTGSTWIDGPGFGAYVQTEIAHVNAGDLIAMALKANGHTYYAFTSANADGTTHVWNYGLNTYGWEDLYGGGDQDYNDLVVQLDFTSTAGHGYLV